MTDALVEAVALATLRSEYGLPEATPDGMVIAMHRHRNNATAALQAIEAAGYRVVPVDDIDLPLVDSLLPEDMIDAGISVLNGVHVDMMNYVPGVTTDWDDGMVAVAVYRAMLSAAPRVFNSDNVKENINV